MNRLLFTAGFCRSTKAKAFFLDILKMSLKRYGTLPKTKIESVTKEFRKIAKWCTLIWPASRLKPNIAVQASWGRFARTYR